MNRVFQAILYNTTQYSTQYVYSYILSLQEACHRMEYITVFVHGTDSDCSIIKPYRYNLILVLCKKLMSRAAPFFMLLICVRSVSFISFGHIAFQMLQQRRDIATDRQTKKHILQDFFGLKCKNSRIAHYIKMYLTLPVNKQ